MREGRCRTSLPKRFSSVRCIAAAISFAIAHRQECHLVVVGQMRPNIMATRRDARLAAPSCCRRPGFTIAIVKQYIDFARHYRQGIGMPALCLFHFACGRHFADEGTPFCQKVRQSMNARLLTPPARTIAARTASECPCATLLLSAMKNFQVYADFSRSWRSTKFISRPKARMPCSPVSEELVLFYSAFAAIFPADAGEKVCVAISRFYFHWHAKVTPGAGRYQRVNDTPMKAQDAYGLMLVLTDTALDCRFPAFSDERTRGVSNGSMKFPL